MSSLTPKKLRLRVVLIVSFLLVAAAPIALLSAQRYHFMSREFLQEGLTEDMTLAHAVASGLQSYVARHRHLVAVLAEEVRQRGLGDPGLSTTLDIARLRYPAFRTLLVVDDGGTAVAFSPGKDDRGQPTIGRRYADRDWFLKLIRGEREPTYDVTFSRLLSTPTVTISAPIITTAGRIVGAVAGNIDLDEIRHAVKGADPRRTDRLVLVDRTGRVIAHASREWELDARDLSREPSFTSAQQEPRGSYEYTSPVDGQKHWGTFLRLQTGGWVLWANSIPAPASARNEATAASAMSRPLLSAW